MNLDGAIKQLFPNAINGVDYLLQDDSDGKGPYIKEWKKLLGTKPTQAVLQVASDAYEAKRASIAYKEQRKAEYPSIGDQLDNIWRWAESAGLIAEINAQVGTPEKMLSDIHAIKARYPKPQ